MNWKEGFLAVEELRGTLYGEPEVGFFFLAVHMETIVILPPILGFWCCTSLVTNLSDLIPSS